MATTAWRRLNATRDHGWAQPRISEYLDGELSARDRRRLADHETLCPECAYLVATLRALLEMLPALRVPPQTASAIAEQTAARVAAQIEEWHIEEGS